MKKPTKRDDKTVRGTYSTYKKKSKSENPVSIQDFMKINNAFSKFLVEELLLGKAIFLPGGLGVVKVSGKKQKIKVTEDGKVKGAAVDWKTTKELWARNPKAKEEKKRIFFTNEHSDGIRYYFKWSNYSVPLANKVFYEMVMNRRAKRLLAKVIRAGASYEVEQKDLKYIKRYE